MLGRDGGGGGGAVGAVGHDVEAVQAQAGHAVQQELDVFVAEEWLVMEQGQGAGSGGVARLE